MTRSFVQHRRYGYCDVCGRRSRQMWQHTVTGFIYCDDCRYGFPADDLVRVV